MKTVWKAFLTILAMLALAGPATASASNLTFNIAAEPAQADWAYFLKAPMATKIQIWRLQAKQGVKLGDWHWGWRLAWVRACHGQRSKFCVRRLADALFDDAMVVRAQAAVKLGEAFADSGQGKVVNLLRKAYDNPRNIRNGKPLYVQQRIVFAISQVGGKAALAVGDRLAKQDPTIRNYWQRISRL